MIVRVESDFSQFYLRRPGGWFAADSNYIGLANVDDEHGAVLLTVYQQHGPVAVEVTVEAAAPAPLGEEWADIAEVPLLAPAPTLLADWNPHGATYPIPLDFARPHRLRYAIDPSRDPTRYLLQLWPADPAPAAVVRAESPQGQFWAFQAAAQLAKADADLLPEGTRTRYMIERGLGEHPETAGNIARGDERYAVGVLAYTQKIYPREMSHEQQREMIIEIARGMAH